MTKEASPTSQELASDPSHIRYVRTIAAKFAAKVPWLADEFESAVYVAIMEAAKTFDSDRGIPFRTHLTNRAIGEMRDVCRSWAPHGFRRVTPGAVKASPPEILSLSFVFEDSGYRLTTLEDLLASQDCPVGWEEEFQDLLIDLTRGLSPQERDVICRLFGRADQDKKWKVGQHLGVVASRVSQIYASAIERMKLLHSNPRSDSHEYRDEDEGEDEPGRKRGRAIGVHAV